MNAEESQLVIKNLLTRILINEFTKISEEKEGLFILESSRLKEDLDLDSLEVLEMILCMEDVYKISIDNTKLDFKSVKTVEDLAIFIAPRLGPPS